MHGSETPSRAQERDRFNLGWAALADIADGRNPGFLLPGPLVAISHAREERRKREEDRQSERSAFRQLLDALDARLAAIKAEMDAIEKRLGEIRDRRIKIGEAMAGAEDILEIRKRGGKIDARNPAHKKMLDALGITEAEANGHDYAAIIARRRADLDREDAGLATEWDQKLKRRDQLGIEYAGAMVARNEIENANTDEARILAARRAETVLGAQQLGTAAYISHDKDAKLIAAEAVAAKEPEQAQPESAAFNRDAVAGDKKAIAQSDLTFRFGQ